MGLSHTVNNNSGLIHVELQGRQVRIGVSHPGIETGRIDAVIDTRKHRSLDAPFRVGKAVWIRSHEQGLRLGELRVGPSGVVDRKIDLDDRVPDHPTLRALADDADAEIKALRERLFGP